MNTVEKTGVVTPKCRMAWPALLQARTNKLNGKAEYGVVLVFDKETDLSALKNACKVAAKNKWGEKIPSNLRLPFRSGNDDSYSKYPEFKDKVVIRVSTTTPPGVVDNKVQPVLDAKEIYGGRWCIAALNAGSYDQAGNRGVSLYLNHIQILDHDKPFAGASRAEDIFQPVSVQGTSGKADNEDIFA